jgi:hypothetical protein
MDYLEEGGAADTETIAKVLGTTYAHAAYCLATLKDKGLVIASRAAGLWVYRSAVSIPEEYQL